MRALLCIVRHENSFGRLHRRTPYESAAELQVVNLQAGLEHLLGVSQACLRQRCAGDHAGNLVRALFFLHLPDLGTRATVAL